MIKTIIGIVITMVIGLALLPVVATFVDGLTGVGMTYAGTSTGTLIDLLPILYVLILVAGSAGAIYFTVKN